MFFLPEAVLIQQDFRHNGKISRTGVFIVLNSGFRAALCETNRQIHARFTPLRQWCASGRQHKSAPSVYIQFDDPVFDRSDDVEAVAFLIFFVAFSQLAVCPAPFCVHFSKRNARKTAGILHSSSTAVLHMNYNFDRLFPGCFSARISGRITFTRANRVTTALRSASTRRTLCFRCALLINVFWKDFHRIFLSSDSFGECFVITVI